MVQRRPVYGLRVICGVLPNVARWAMRAGVCVAAAGLAVVAGVPAASADPPPLPPPAQFDARGVGMGTNADLGASPAQMPKRPARDGSADRVQRRTDIRGGAGSLSSLDPGATLTSAPPPAAAPIPQAMPNRNEAKTTRGGWNLNLMYAT